MTIMNGIAKNYIEESALARRTIGQAIQPTLVEPAPFKKYPEAPTVAMNFSWNLEEARISPLFQQRRSVRKYADAPLELEDIAFMLWGAQGITAKAGKHFFRSTPSAGALYPFETYIYVNNVIGLKPGLYHFDVFDFALEFIDEHAEVDKLAASCLGQSFIKDAAVTFVWTGVLSRNYVKYKERALRYILLDLGHLGQNLLISAEAKGCGGCPIAAFFDDELNGFLDIDGEDEFALYAMTVGKKLKK